MSTARNGRSEWTRRFNMLYWFLLVWTCAYMAVCVAVFFGHGTWKKNWQVPPGMDWAYIGILSFYVSVKEVRRYQNVHNIQRKGEFFVYAWGLLLLGMYLIMAFLGPAYELPRDMLEMFGTSLVIYGLGMGLKWHITTSFKAQGRSSH